MLYYTVKVLKLNDDRIIRQISKTIDLEYRVERLYDPFHCIIGLRMKINFKIIPILIFLINRGDCFACKR